MIKQKEHFHGSDLEKIEQIYHIKKENITSFSANVNPLGISSYFKKTLANHIDCITSYPDREYTSLRKSISTYTGAKLEHIFVGNGATELISIFINYIKPVNAVLTAPSYSEYEREINLAGGKCQHYFLKEEHNFRLNPEDLIKKLTDNIQLLVLCNPNNPTSGCINSIQLSRILDHCIKHHIYVLIDETYIEFTDNMKERTAIPLANKYKNLIILRGISKFFAAPGLRLGYAICSDNNFLHLVNEKKNPWTINSLAAVAGEIMFTDDNYIHNTRTLIANERVKVVSALRKETAFKVYEPTANFVLVRIKDKTITAYDLFEETIRHELMIRDCSTFEGLDDYYFRICFMSPEKNNELLKIITSYMNTHRS